MTDQPEPLDEPDVGKAFSMSDWDMVLEAVKERQLKDPKEPTALCLYVVLTKIGERYRKVQCLEQEWEGLKKDVQWERDGQPTCPNGHSLHPGSGLTLGWVYVD